VDPPPGVVGVRKVYFGVKVRDVSDEVIVESILRHLTLRHICLFKPMAILRVLGYADEKACTFALDPALPHSQVSPAFLFRNSLHPRLGTSGRACGILTVLVPSQGGYYTSENIRFAFNKTNGSDVVLGADWMSACRVMTAANTVLSPSLESVSRLPSGHVWTANSEWLCR
jgi:hypothetical protein